MDGHLKDEDVNLASSTLVQDGKSTGDACGIVISYSVRIKLNCGTLGGEIQTDVPFKLLQPAPGKWNFKISISNTLISIIFKSKFLRFHWKETFECHEENEIHWTAS